jgi:hypothetical protein
MMLPACVLQWPQPVSRQVMSALFMPAADLHPDQARSLVPRALWALPAADLSRGLEPVARQWPQEIDGRRIEHRLALLPRSVLEQVSWNLGLLLAASSLRKRVLRSELQTLAEHGLSEDDWALVHQAPRSAALPPVELPTNELPQWPELLRHAGAQALLALTAPLGQILGARLTWKLPPGEPASSQAPSATLLKQAYAPAVHRWSTDWDDCLGQIHGRTH